MATTMLPFGGVPQGIPNTPMGRVQTFAEVDPIFPDRNLRISGVTYDSTGAVLPGCAVHLKNRADDRQWDQTVSDADGSFMLTIPVGLNQAQNTTWYLVAYKAGSPDVAGVTINTLTGS